MTADLSKWHQLGMPLGVPTYAEVLRESSGAAVVVREPLPPIPEGGFLLVTLASGISAGTELSVLSGTNPKARFDPAARIFRAEAVEQASDQARLGYMQVGVVVASRNPNVPVGQVRATRSEHCTAVVLGPADFSIELPDDVHPLLGTYAAQMWPICGNIALFAADFFQRHQPLDELQWALGGARVAVFGAGVVGQLTGLIAQWAGADVVVVDQDESRLALTRAVGLETVSTIDPSAGAMVNRGTSDIASLLKARWAGSAETCGADVALHCAPAPSGEMLAAALASVRTQGAVIDAALHPSGAAAVRLGDEFHHNNLSLICAQIGRQPRTQSEHWDRRRLSESAVAFLQDPRYSAALLGHLVTHVGPMSRAPAAYAALAARQAVQVVLVPDWVRPGYLTNGLPLSFQPVPVPAPAPPATVTTVRTATRPVTL